MSVVLVHLYTEATNRALHLTAIPLRTWDWVEIDVTRGLREIQLRPKRTKIFRSERYDTLIIYQEYQFSKGPVPRLWCECGDTSDCSKVDP